MLLQHCFILLKDILNRVVRHTAREANARNQQSFLGLAYSEILPWHLY
jgi:hypothetical protein